MFEYRVESKWSGWAGGWGSESDIAGIMNGFAGQGWRLISTKNVHALWFWIVPRPKLLMVFERQVPIAGQAPTPPPAEMQA